MSLIFAAIVPNNPRLAEHAAEPAAESGSRGSRSIKDSRTFAALREIEGELYCMRPDALILLTSYGARRPETVTLNVADKLHGFSPSVKEYIGGVQLASDFKEEADTNKQQIPLSVDWQQTIPPRALTPLLFLLDHLPKIKVVMLSTSNLSLKNHFSIGVFLRQKILLARERVAVVASGHLAATDASPSLDQLCLTFLKEREPEKIINLDPCVCQKSKTDLLAPLAILLGIIHDMNTAPFVHSYEQLYDEGQIVANFVIQ